MFELCLVGNGFNSSLKARTSRHPEMLHLLLMVLIADGESETPPDTEFSRKSGSKKAHYIPSRNIRDGPMDRRTSFSRPTLYVEHNTHFRMVSLTLTSWYQYPSWITMSTMKKKKKGADDPPVNNNRSDHKSKGSKDKK